MKNVFLTIFLAVVLGAAPARAADGWSNFSADMEMTSSEGRMSGKIYTADKKSRMEMAGNIIINRMDRNVAWVIMPSERMYLEQHIDPKMAASVAGSSSSEVERVPMGKESVDGAQVDKFKVTYQSSGTRESVYEWSKSGLAVPVKIASIDGDWSVLYRNVRTGSQPADLFEIPTGFQKLAVPGMGQMPDMSGMYGGQQ